MDPGYPIGVRIMIEETKGLKFEGSITFCNKNIVTISDVLEYPQTIKHASLVHFDYKDIKAVNVLIDITPAKPQPLFNNELVVKMKNLSKKYKYISKLGKEYNFAVEHLNIYSEFAVHALVTDYDSNLKISILAIATENETFIFDIQLLGKNAFCLGLRDLFQTDEITKIIYKSKQLAECLSQTYNTKLGLIYDIQATDFIISHGENHIVPDGVRSLSEIITDYCNIPPNTIGSYEPDDTELKQRPLSEELMLNSALKVAYMYYLKNVLQDRQVDMQMQNLV